MYFLYTPKTLWALKNEEKKGRKKTAKCNYHSLRYCSYSNDLSWKCVADYPKQTKTKMNTSFSPSSCAGPLPPPLYRLQGPCLCIFPFENALLIYSSWFHRNIDNLSIRSIYHTLNVRESFTKWSHVKIGVGFVANQKKRVDNMKFRHRR